DLKPLGSFHIGSLLPNQFDGVTEIQPMFGFRYATPYRGKSLVEFGAAVSKAEGVDLFDGTVSFRGNFPVEDFIMLAYIGIDLYYYSPPDEDFQLGYGGHVGGGFIAHVVDVVYFRSDMKFGINPGTSLYIGFGIEIEFSEGSKDK
ncbi:MAG: hypothetical protein KDD25_07195, partial [Bdellovibrionales bacterium]|nr:hypothetical protein [Bdellovibrionales bacterium]